jgi:hypothetical protein
MISEHIFIYFGNCQIKTYEISTIESLRKGSKMAGDFDNNQIAQKVAIDIIIS